MLNQKCKTNVDLKFHGPVVFVTVIIIIFLINSCYFINLMPVAKIASLFAQKGFRRRKREKSKSMMVVIIEVETLIAFGTRFQSEKPMSGLGI